MDALLLLVLVVLGCLFPALLVDVLKMNPEDKKYRDKRYAMCACFGGIVLLLVVFMYFAGGAT